MVVSLIRIVFVFWLRITTIQSRHSYGPHMVQFLQTINLVRHLNLQIVIDRNSVEDPHCVPQMPVNTFHNLS